MKTKHRLVALMLSLIMLCSALPFTAAAEEDYGIEVLGTMLTPSNYEEFLEEYCLGQIAYDPPTNTLTFSGFMRSMVDSTPVVLYHGKDTVNVVLKWGNHVSGIFFESDEGSIAFSAESTGSLGFGKTDTGQTGIRCAYMDVDGGSIMMTNFTNGIKANLISVTGGSLAILADAYYALTAEHGISANEMRVSGGEVYVCGYSDGLDIGDSLTVSGGDVIVEDATRAVSVRGYVSINGTGVLNVEGDAVGIEASVVAVTGSAELHAKATYGETKPAILTHSYFAFDKNTHFIKKPVKAKIAAHPEGGETVFDGNGNIATEVSVVPWIACSVSRNGGAEERVEWSFENRKVNLFQCPVGETVTVRLVSYDEYGTFDTTVNGQMPHAHAFVTETISGKSEKSFTFSPEYRLESEMPTTSFGQPSGASDQFSYYHNIFFRQLGSSRQVGVLVFETLKGDLTFDEIKTQTVDINKMHTIPLPMNDSRGNAVVQSKDGAPNAEDLEVKLTGDKIFLTYIVKSFDDRYVLYVLPGAIGTATVTVSFKGNMSYNPAQITFSVVCQCNDCADGANDSALTHHIATDSTCKVRGNDEYWECGNCGALYGAKGDDGKRPWLAEVPYRPLNPDNHTNIFIMNDDPAWCDRAGTFSGYCNDCNKGIQETYAINPDHHHAHTFEEVQGQDATCTESGTAAHYACSACGKKYTQAVSITESLAITSQDDEITDTVIPANGHVWEDAVKDEYLKSEADCENPAVYYKSCEHCGISTKEFYDLQAAAASFTPGSTETVTIDGVEFYILAVDDGKALLLTKELLDEKAFDADSSVWEGSDIQQWLNGEWLSGKPRLSAIAEPAEIHTAAKYDDQENTVVSRDKVFLLSEADITNTHNSKTVTNTALYTYNGERLTAPGGASWGIYGVHWWLRSPRNFSQYVTAVTDFGNVHSYVYSQPLPVRPAMWVRFADPAPEWQTKIESITPGSADTVTIDGFEFHVLAKENGNALLLTKHVLFNKSELSFGKTPSWADSKLREFMNGIRPELAGGERFFFPNQAPTLAQYAQETEIYTPAGYNSTELVMTRDRMFLLSEADLFGTQNDHPEAGSNVFTYNGAPLPAPGGSWIATDVNGTPRYWWLRSLRLNKYSVAQVLDNGNLNSINSDVEDSTGIRGVRPALWIQYKEPVPEPATFTYGDALGHLWSTANYSWSVDPVSGDRTCTAQHTCTREGCLQGEYEKVTATREVTIAPTCTKQGQYTYTATFTKAGFETRTTTSPIPPLGGGHEWQVEGWTWDYPDLGRVIAYGDYAAYPQTTLKLKCQKCGDSVSVTVDKPELQLLAEGDVCTGGKRSFIATVQYEGVEYSDKNTFETINAEGHVFGNPTYDWVENLSVPDIYVCIATRVCTRDGCAHKEEEEVTVQGIKTLDPACGKAGQYTYTAEFKNPAFKTQTKQVPIDPLEHNWVEKVEDKYLKSAADCTNAAVYYKSCEHCGITHDSEIFTHGDPLGHNLVHHDAKAATCTEHGWNEYDTCSRCDYTTYSEIDALSHVFDEWYVEKQPTDREKGIEKRLCKNCDYFETRELDMIEYKAEPVGTEHGDAEINPENPKSGDDVKITPKPDEGFEVDEIKVTDKDGNEIEVKKNDDGSFTFVMPEDDVKIEVTFKKTENDLPVAPQTGDNFNIALWTILMCLAVSGVVYAVAWKRQRKRVKGS